MTNSNQETTAEQPSHGSGSPRTRESGEGGGLKVEDGQSGNDGLESHRAVVEADFLRRQKFWREM
jgi:hypothetical protein